MVDSTHSPILQAFRDEFKANMRKWKGTLHTRVPDFSGHVTSWKGGGGLEIGVRFSRPYYALKGRCGGDRKVTFNVFVDGSDLCGGANSAGVPESSHHGFRVTLLRPDVDPFQPIYRAFFSTVLDVQRMIREIHDATPTDDL